MAGQRPRRVKCKNRQNHNCSPCPYCDASEHDYKPTGQCKICGEWDYDHEYDGIQGGFQKINGRVVKKDIDDDE